jgi:very-short-patch-repair endonuclease
MAYLGKSVEKDMFFGAKPKLFIYAKELRKNPTEAENRLWIELKKYRKRGLTFRRQHPIDIFIADFYCHTLKLVIEVDGEIHDNEINVEYDIGRSAELEKFNITVLRVKNFEIFTEFNNVIRKINQLIFDKSPSLLGEGDLGGEVK